ncbi:hypothetical protein FRC06_003991, partial [Ceratobasidium sp. 370]
MPMYLEAELAKNHSPVAASCPPLLGEDIFLFQLQTKDLLVHFQIQHPQDSHPDTMNWWYAQHISGPQEQQVQNPTASNASPAQAPAHHHLSQSQNSELESLALNSVCVEMMLKCGQAE